jgi:hypothetical protein
LNQLFDNPHPFWVVVNQIAESDSQRFFLKASSTRVLELERHLGKDYSLDHIYTSHKVDRLNYIAVAKVVSLATAIFMLSAKSAWNLTMVDNLPLQRVQNPVRIRLSSYITSETGAALGAD